MPTVQERRRLGGSASLIGVVAVAAVVTIAAIVALASRRELAAAARAAGHARPGWLAVLGLGLAGWWLAWVLVTAGARRAAGAERTPMRELVPVVLASVAINSVVSSGGLAGLGVHVAQARRRHRLIGPITAGYLVAVAVVDVAFTVTLAAALAVILWQGRLSIADIVAGALFLGVLAVKIGAVLAAVRSPRLVGAVQRRWPGVRPMADALALVARDPRTALPAMVAAVGIDAAAVLMLWAAVASVGAGSRPATALTVYAVSGLFGIVSVVPGGLGFVEVGAVAGLVASGLGWAPATAAVALFRIVEFWIPLAVGGLAALALGRRAAR